MHDARTAGFGGIVVFLDHVPHEGRLARQVDVIGAGFDTGRDQRFAIQQIGADRGDDDPRPCDHRVQRRRVRGICLDQGRIGRQAHLVAHRRKLGCAATGHGPGTIRIGRVDVFRDQPPRKSSCAVDDDIEFSHVPFLPDWLHVFAQLWGEAGGIDHHRVWERCVGVQKKRAAADATARLEVSKLRSDHSAGSFHASRSMSRSA